MIMPQGFSRLYLPKCHSHLYTEASGVCTGVFLAQSDAPHRLQSCCSSFHLAEQRNKIGMRNANANLIPIILCHVMDDMLQRLFFRQTTNR